MDEMIKLWKKLKIETAQFHFSCGGDSMNDTSMTFHGKNGKEITEGTSELESYFENEVYNNVQFYEASDGHYIGEHGIVHITLDEEEEDFNYSKSSKSEWSETMTSEMEVKLPEKAIEFIKKNVLNINGGQDGGCVINYKKDLILSDKEVKLVEELENKILNEASNFVPDQSENEDEGEVEDWFTFTTNEEGEEIKIKENSLVVSVRNSVTVLKEGED